MGNNDLIFHELLKRGYTLEGQTRVWSIADSKLWYLTPEQAQSFLDLENEPDYVKSVTSKEIELIKKHLPAMASNLPNPAYNIVDLGCGDGKKAALLIGELSKHLRLRYCPIDISAYMVKKAADTIKRLKVSEVVEFKWNISDFENLNNVTPLLRNSNFPHNFTMLLGNTLGNFDVEDLLHGIKTSMQPGDRLLIGNGIADGRSEAEWVETYTSETINSMMMNTVKLIGLTHEDVEYDVRFVNSRIEEIYRLKRDRKIRHLWHSIEFKQGDIIVTIVSGKYSLPKLQGSIAKFFPNPQIFTDKQQTYALALCSY